MKKVLILSISVLFIVVLFALPASAQGTLVRFRGGIGVIPVSNVAGAGTQNADASFPDVNVTRNIVRGVNPAGQIWVIRELEARIRTNGAIRVEGKGLILGGGNNAGRATGQNVFATLICEAAGPFTERNTNLAGVPLSNDGDFKIDDVLSPSPVGCASPMLLIRNASGLAWFAVGIPD